MNGDKLEIIGTNPPCKNCQGAMRQASFGGGRIIYSHDGDGTTITNVWENGSKLK